jgi:quercetin dioxygenase-like cupin family protein
MRIRPLEALAASPVEGIAGVDIRRVGRSGRAELKAFTIRAGHATPAHVHHHQHVVVVLAGAGRLSTASGDRAIRIHDVVTVAPDEFHGFAAVGDADLELLCLDAPRESAVLHASSSGGSALEEAVR